MKKRTLLMALLLPLLCLAQKPELVVPLGHSGRNVTHSYSPDGQYIATFLFGDPAVKIWSREGKELAALQSGERFIASARFTDDGLMVVELGYRERVEGDLMEYISFPYITVWRLDGTIAARLEGKPSATLEEVKSVYLEKEGRTLRLPEARQEPPLPAGFPVRGYARSMSAAFFGADGQSVIANGAWDLERNRIQPAEEERPFFSGFTGDLLWSPGREYIFGTSADEPVPALYPQTEAAEAVVQAVIPNGFAGHTAPVTAAAFSPDGQYILTGSNDQMARLWNLKGEELQAFPGHPGPVWSVCFHPERPLVLTGTEKMAKIWRRGAQEELASLIQIGAADWVVIAPSGLFDASPGAMRLLHYSVFYEAASEYLAIDVEQLKSRYYEPGLLQKLLGYSDERIRPVEGFEEVRLYPKVAAEIQQDTLIIRLQARNGGIGKVSIFINGKEVAEEANPLPRVPNPQRDSLIRFPLSGQRQYLLRHPDSTNTISIRAYNEAGWLKSPAHHLEYQLSRARRSNAEGRSSAWEGKLNPKLYAICIGTSDYTGEQLDLQYADQDATMMARALQSVGTALFTNGDSLEVHCLSTAAADSTGLEGTPVQWQFADKKNIEAAFRAVRQRAKAEDVLLVYLSGHGLARSGRDQTQFYYLTQGVAREEDLNDPATLAAYTLSSEELTRWINDVPALKQVLIVDACNSGQVVEDLTAGAKTLNSSQIRAFDRMKDRTGMFVLSGSASDKVSYEASEYGQGLLTYALLQGMLGLATRKDRQGQDVVDVMELFQYARDEVPNLARGIGIQTPTLGFPAGAASFDIGILDEEAKRRISIGNKKPVFTRSVFLNKETFLDGLQLAEGLETAFRKETKRGSNARLIYVDVHDYPGAYSVSGLYEQTAEGIKLEAKLFLDKANPVRLQIAPQADPERLIRALMRAVREALQE